MRVRSEILGVVAMAAAPALAQEYPTPSFDCANTTTQQELRICRSQALSELDGRHGSLVERAVRSSPDRERTREAMDAWLERVRNPCQTDQCLVDAYTSHIRELERIVPAALPQPAFTLPVQRDVAPVTKSSPEPAKPASRPETAAPKTVPPPEPVSSDEGEDDEETSDSMTALVLAALALGVWGVFRAARRAPVNARGERDASGDRP
jgi:uncharacterized protein